ncbi:hypothetical protein KQI63_07175 [bacterium]|nr:hypothetical protein [bacterium]
MARRTFTLPFLCFSLAALLLVGTNPLHAQDNAESEDLEGPRSQIAGELGLEKQVAERLEAMLQPIVGPVVVVVDLTLTSIPVELQGFKYSKDESLPGLPVTISENVRKLGGSNWDFNEVDGIKIRVFVSESMQDAELNRITELIPLWINLNYGRGDQIIVEPVPFVNPPLTMVDFLLSWKGVALIGAGVVLLSLIVSLILRFLTRPARLADGGEMDLNAHGNISGPISPMSVAQMMTQMSEEKEKEDRGRRETEASVPSTSMLTLPEGSLSVRLVRENDGSNRALGALTKIRDMELSELNLLLKDANPTTCAVALNLVRPVMAAHFLSNLAQESRSRVLEAWKNLDSISTSDAQQYAAQLRERVERMKTSELTASGPEPFIELINQAPESAGKAVFNDLMAIDSELAAEVRKKAFFLEDLLQLEGSVLKRIVMGMQRDQLASLVKDAPDEIKERVYQSLSSRAANVLREEVSLLNSVPPEKAAMAKRALMEALRRVQSVNE